jgi:hypothetical protein
MTASKCKHSDERWMVIVTCVATYLFFSSYMSFLRLTQDYDYQTWQLQTLRCALGVVVRKLWTLHRKSVSEENITQAWHGCPINLCSVSLHTTFCMFSVIRGVPSPDDRIFLLWRIAFLGPEYGTCFMLSFWLQTFCTGC